MGFVYSWSPGASLYLLMAEGLGRPEAEQAASLPGLLEFKYCCHMGSCPELFSSQTPWGRSVEP